MTREQIELLPQGERNFLNFAALAPGVYVTADENATQTLRSAGMSAKQVNAFIDGLSYKNDLDGRFAATLAGKEWLASVESGSPGAPLLTPRLPRAEFVVQAHGRPAEDSRISVWMLGTWGNEGQGGRLVADALLGVGSFPFSAARGEGEAIEHCCPGCPFGTRPTGEERRVRRFSGAPVAVAGAQPR